MTTQILTQSNDKSIIQNLADSGRTDIEIKAWKDSLYRLGFMEGVHNIEGWPLRPNHEFTAYYCHGYVIGHFYNKQYQLKNRT